MCHNDVHRCAVVKVNRVQARSETVHYHGGGFVEKKKWHLQFSLYLSAQFRCRFSCASWGTCCFSGLSSFLRPSCYRFLFDLFLGLPTKAFHLEVKRTNGDITTQTLTHRTVNCKPKNRARSHVMSTVLKSLHPAACSVYYWALINFMQLLGISP